MPSIAPEIFEEQNPEVSPNDIRASFGEDDASPAIRPLNLWRPSQFLEWQEPAGIHLLLPAYITLGSLTTLIGQGGLGKSRLALWLAICQILRRLWCGLETAGEPAKWVFLGDENSIARWKEDLTRMFSVLSPEERAQLDSHLLLPAADKPGDVDCWMGDDATVARISATLEHAKPGVVVGDPLGNLAPGDVSKPGEMKEAIRLFLATVRRAAPESAILLLHHARTGRSNIVQSIGYDAANFGMGGKALFSAARCQLNLAPGSEDDDTRLVLSCAKSNDCQRFETRGLVFDPRNFTYATDPGFDVGAWKASIEGKARPGQALCTIADVLDGIRDGHASTKALVPHLMDTFSVSKRSVERLISKAVEFQALKPIKRGNYMLGPKSAKYSEATL